MCRNKKVRDKKTSKELIKPRRLRHYWKEMLYRSPIKNRFMCTGHIRPESRHLTPGFKTLSTIYWVTDCKGAG